MLGGKNQKPLGYTIIEVMIVLAVSGMMFLIAATFINGKQQRAAFTEGVNEMASRLQGVIEQVNNGQYSDINLNCNFDSTQPAPSKVSFPLGANAQGSNSPCVFLGKLLYFSPDASVPNSSKYEIFSIAGGRLDASGNPITTPQAAGAHVIPGLTTTETVPQNLNINDVQIQPIFWGASSYALAFLQNPSVDASNNLANGAETVNMYYVWGLNAANGTPENVINGGTFLVKATRAKICLTDGTSGTRQYAEVTLGTTGGKLSVDVKMDGTTSC